MTRINTNVSSLAAQKSLARSNVALQQSLTRLSTGVKINTGKDDPAGMIAGEFLRSNISSMSSEIKAAQSETNQIQIADAAMGEIALLLVDVRGIVSLAASSGGQTAEEVTANQAQIDSSIDAINRIAATTSFGSKPLDGGLFGFEGSSEALGSADVGFLASLKGSGSSDLQSGNSAQASAIVEQVSNQVATRRAKLGAQQSSQLESVRNTLGSAIESLSSSLSAIRDADLAVEVAGQARSGALANVGTSLLAMANAGASQALRLLSG